MKNQISESFKKDYHLCEEIGRGKFGVVYHCISTSTGDSYAAKCLDKRQLLSDDLDSRCLEIEPKLLQILSPHPNILQIHDLYGSDPDSNHLIIITELCDNSTLYDRLTLSLFTESDACNVITQIISALAHCHRHGIAHRDIKPENVLFDSTGRRVKLIDFGSAEWFGDHKRDGEMMSGVVGTPYYVAPEVLLGREYDEKIDVWSVGVILYIMLGGVPPFYGDGVEEIFRAVIRGNLRFPTKSFRSVSTEAKDLIRKMLCKDSSRRLSAEQVLRHPWILSGGINNSLADSGI